MMTNDNNKRQFSDAMGSSNVDPILICVSEYGTAPRVIRIDKEEFKVGRGLDNDEILMSVTVSRQHCIFKYEGNSEWAVKNLSSCGTLVNDVPIGTEFTKLRQNDIVQFGTSPDFRFCFLINDSNNQIIKKPRLDKHIMDSVLIEQKTFAEVQTNQKMEIKKRLDSKQQELEQLKVDLQELLLRQNDTKEDEGLTKQIIDIQHKIKVGNAQKQDLKDSYSELLEKLEKEREQFEIRLDEERKKWQEALNMSKQENDQLEIKMREQMEKWREQQQIEWKSLMEDKVRQERLIQVRLMNEKYALELKLKDTEKALKEQEAKAEAAMQSTVTDNCIVLLENIDNIGELQIIDTIDLTAEPMQYDMPKNSNNDGVINKVGDIMDEQFSCSICSELFIAATTLNCTHTFCEYCIQSWIKKKKECPVCRAPIKAMNRSLVLDNFIASMVETLPTLAKEKREEIMKERFDIQKKTKRGSKAFSCR